MTRRRDSLSPPPADVTEHYDSGYEEGRLTADQGMIERERSRELIGRFLPKVPARILDIGGGPGGHALWLAKKGYEVHLVDIVPLHIEQAKKASNDQPGSPLASAHVGDACDLLWSDNSADAVLLFGPLYHLTDKNDRKRALGEASRVLKPNGVLMAVGVSRFASTLDGLRAGYLKDPDFVEIVNRDLVDGQHRNNTNKPEYFMDTFFHHPDELREEVKEGGFEVRDIFGVEGPSWLASDIGDWWKNDVHRLELLRIARALETEPSMLGVNAHLMAVATKK